MTLTRWGAAVVSVFVLGGCRATLPVAGGDTTRNIGRVYHYVRSNRDGSEPESVSVFRLDRTHLEVFKRRERCTSAALVTAELDSSLTFARGLIGGRLQPENRRQAVATLTWHPDSRRIVAAIDLPDFMARDSVTVPDQPWHLYDFDLASLTVAYRADPRADFSFGMPLILVRESPSRFLQNLGRADARFVGDEQHAGRPALRFEVGGPAFGTRGGPLWFDRDQGHILEAAWGVPNHTEYHDFRLRLIGVNDGGALAWDSLLRAHFTSCPAR
ncbi:MAG: hypothetical protein H7099_15890 [Gemmatimonadaceae bacterium]|nr:hypothetical protein [Gemmatimonadaceae bacterium]